MLHIYTLPLILFILFDIAYTIFCVRLYIRLAKSYRNRSKSHSAIRKLTIEKAAVIIITMFSVYIMNKWIVLQSINGCTQTFFWNPICYDLNEFSRAWLAICFMIGLNAIALSIIYDLRTQSRILHKK